MQKGTLKKWNDEKGFGFILLENSSEELFFHISSLQSSARRPKVGDIVYFNIETDENGRKRAASVSLQGVKSVFAEKVTNRQDVNNRQKPSSKIDSYGRRPHASIKTNDNRILSKIFNVVIFLVAVFFIHKFYKENQFAKSSEPSSVFIQAEPETKSLANISQFQCAGKTRCSQMTSCEEALFYLRNCRGSVTDGDGDGLPCEDQWCGH